MLRALLSRAGLCLLLAVPLPAAAYEIDGLEVDVELFLAVDVSRSMSPAELEIQRRGYAEALTSPEVLEAIRGGLIGRIALTYVEWAGAWSQREIVGWTLIETEAEARAFAEEIRNAFDPSLRRTSISGALLYAARSFEGNGFQGLRRVIDVSGDGPNNDGRPVLLARRTVLDEGITINGLPLMTRDGLGQRWHLEDLDAYYVNCVIGGPGAFSIPVFTWDQFEAAVRRKLVLEIAGRMPAPRAVPAMWRGGREGAAYDCMIGEKIWEENRRTWGMP